MPYAGASVRRRVPLRLRATRYVRRRLLPSDGFALGSLAAAAVGVGWLTGVQPRWMPVSALAVIVLVGGYVLTLRSLVLLYGVVAAVVVGITAVWGRIAVPPGAVGVIVATSLLVLGFARTRNLLGVQGARGETMLVDLRDRLRAQGEMPELPPGWQAEVALRSAYGASFSGDFLVATRTPDGQLLEVVLVDVSGKGLAAGTRALMLSGALGGLLGAMPPEEFLPAANHYLLRQRWEEGFATAAHVVIDLVSGDYWVASAGHPPPAHFAAGSGRWRTIDETAGLLLGVLPEAVFPPEKGRLEPGDALLLYTDGLIETPGRDLSIGIDRLIGEAERLVPRGFRSGARQLVDSVDADDSDDRGLVLIWRE